MAFMHNFGYNSLREAKKVFKLIERQTQKLERLLGDDFDDALWNSEKWIPAHT
jgi:hypothetical protein